MKQIEIIKAHKKLSIGDRPNVEDAYADKLVKAGIAKIVAPKKDK